MAPKRKRDDANGDEGEDLLRTIAPSLRHFWKRSVAEQRAQTVVDVELHYFRRNLSNNEIDTLALNEIAAAFRSGWFLHLPTRKSWITKASKCLELERCPQTPGPDYPTIVFCRYRWNLQAYQGFSSDSHRARYLRSSVLASPQLSSTPLWTIQYISSSNVPVFDTRRNTLVLYATTSGYYLCTTYDLRQVLGIDSLHGSVSPPRFCPTPWLWDPQALHKGKDATQRPTKAAALNAFLLNSLEQVYHRIVALCRGSVAVQPTTAAELFSVLPRPVATQAASVGSPLGSNGLTSAEPRSRRGEHRVSRLQRVRMAEERWKQQEEDDSLLAPTGPSDVQSDQEMLDAPLDEAEEVVRQDNIKDDLRCLELNNTWEPGQQHLIRRLLGEHATCPVALEVINTNPTLSLEALEALGYLLDNFPDARYDLNALHALEKMSDKALDEELDKRQRGPVKEVLHAYVIELRRAHEENTGIDYAVLTQRMVEQFGETALGKAADIASG